MMRVSTAVVSRAIQRRDGGEMPLNVPKDERVMQGRGNNWLSYRLLLCLDTRDELFENDFLRAA